MLETIFSFLKLIIPFLLISFVSLFFIKIFRINDLLDKIIVLFLFNWCQVIINIEILSIFKIINVYTLLAAHLLWFFPVLFFTLKNKLKYRIKIHDTKNKLKSFYGDIDINKILKNFLILWLLLIIFITFFLGLSIPPNDYDSMTYHLTRVAFWKQNATLEHFYTNNLRQLTMPVNAEVGLLWIILFTNNDRLVFLVQWTAFLLCLIVLFKILRLCNFNRKISFISVFIFSCLTMIIAQSFSTQNDLILAVFILIAVYFSLIFLKRQNIEIKSIIFSSISLAIAIGIKGYSYLFIPGFYILIFLYQGKFKLRLKRIAYFSIFFITSLLLFSSYNLVQNYMSFGNIFTSVNYIEKTSVENPDFKTFSSNLLKHIFSFYQYIVVDYNFFAQIIEKFLDWYHNLINLDISSSRTNWPGYLFRLEKLTFNVAESYYGPIGFFLVLPSIFYNSLFYFFNRNKIDIRWKKRFIDSLNVSIISFLFFLCYVYIFVWNPWAGRLMIGFISLLFLSVAVTIELIFKIRFKLLSYLLIGLVLVISIFNSFGSMSFNRQAIIIPLKHPSIFSVSYQERRYMQFPDKKIPMDLVDRYIGVNGRLGLITPGNHWDYIFFGNNFKRECIYFSYDELMAKDTGTILKDNNLDGLLILAGDGKIRLGDINYSKASHAGYVLIYKKD